MNTVKDKKKQIDADKQRELAAIQLEAQRAEEARKLSNDLTIIAVCSSMMSCV